MKTCIFCKIVNGEIPTKKIYENGDFLVILDAFPVLRGQILILTKKHISHYVFNLDDKMYTEFMLLAKKFAKVLDRAFNPIKTGMIVEGLEVPHTHIKLLPLMTKGGYGLKPINPPPSKEKLNKDFQKIIENIK